MEESKNSKKKNWLIFGRNLVLLSAIFLIGAYFGKYGYKFTPDGIYQTSVQNNETKLNYGEVDQVYEQLKNNFDGQLDQQKLNDGLKEGLVRSAGDPYTEYLNVESSKEFSEDLSGSFEGIGAELSKKEKYVEVVSPITGYPAEKAGIRSKDVIAEIDGQSAYDISVSEAVKKIRGPKGTKVKLKVVRDGKPIDFEITRETISLPSVTSEMVEGVGVIKVSRFGSDTSSLARSAAVDLKAKGAKGIVLDLRNDPGGLLDSAVDLSSLWLDENQLVVEEKRGGKSIKKINATGDNILKGIPTIVLINSGSASASEITAGALRDHGVATLIGEKSYGKGSVQQVIELTNGASLKVTIARWFTPGGKNIDKEGIKPDVEVKMTDDDYTNKKDPQKDTAISKLK
ncbi:MAG: S41 family peptidase [Patescibacteria group bacterium]